MASRKLTGAIVAIASAAALANQLTVVEDTLWAGADLDMKRDRSTNEETLPAVAREMINGRQGWTGHMLSSYRVSVGTFPDWDEDMFQWQATPRQSTLAIRRLVHPLGWLARDCGLDPEVFTLGVLYAAVAKKEALEQAKKTCAKEQREYDFITHP